MQAEQDADADIVNAARLGAMHGVVPAVVRLGGRRDGRDVGFRVVGLLE